MRYCLYSTEQIVTSGVDGKVTVWDSLDDEEPLQTFKLHSNDVHPLAIRVRVMKLIVARKVFLSSSCKGLVIVNVGLWTHIETAIYVPFCFDQGSHRCESLLQYNYLLFNSSNPFVHSYQSILPEING